MGQKLLLETVLLAIDINCDVAVADFIQTPSAGTYAGIVALSGRGGVCGWFCEKPTPRSKGWATECQRADVPKFNVVNVYQ